MEKFKSVLAKVSYVIGYIIGYIIGVSFVVLKRLFAL